MMVPLAPTTTVTALTESGGTGTIGDIGSSVGVQEKRLTIPARIMHLRRRIALVLKSVGKAPLF
jgi:hypothetical protein